jgi:hypothetical protein
LVGFEISELMFFGPKKEIPPRFTGYIRQPPAKDFNKHHVFQSLNFAKWVGKNIFINQIKCDYISQNCHSKSDTPTADFTTSWQFPSNTHFKCSCADARPSGPHCLQVQHA